MPGNGDGTFQTAKSYDAAPGLGQIVIADMNGDGKMDIVTADGGATFSVRYGNGDGTFSRSVAYSNPGYSVAVADFNGDGAEDLALPSPATAAPAISVYLNTPTVALFPAPLNFGDQTLGVASASQDVTFYNPGSMPLSITGLAAAGDFAAVNSCGDTLAIGANCNVGITFTPSEDGVRNSALQVTDNAPGSPQVVALNGTGVGAPQATGLPANLTFSGQTVGFDFQSADGDPYELRQRTAHDHQYCGEWGFCPDRHLRIDPVSRRELHNERDVYTHGDWQPHGNADDYRQREQ